MNFQIWFESEEEKKSKVKNLLDGQSLIFFFTKDGLAYGAPEDSRLVFARMKVPDDEMPEGWLDDASFIAFDLMRAMMGDRVENMFSKKDLKKIKITDKGDIEKLLLKAPTKGKDIPVKNGTGMIKLKDRK